MSHDYRPVHGDCPLMSAFPRDRCVGINSKNAVAFSNRAMAYIKVRSCLDEICKTALWALCPPKFEEYPGLGKSQYGRDLMILPLAMIQCRVC